MIIAVDVVEAAVDIVVVVVVVIVVDIVVVIFVVFVIPEKKARKAMPFYMTFFCSGEQIEFPFFLGKSSLSSGILCFFCTIMGPSMGPMPTSSQLPSQLHARFRVSRSLSSPDISH